MTQPSSPFLVAPGVLLAGKYRLKAVLGEGAMGSVWKALNESTSREVAVKLIARPEQEFRVRLMREARALGALKHKNVIDIYDIEQTDTGDPFLVMQLLQGETVAELLARKRRLEPPEAARIGRDVARALSAAHAVQIIHRDLKPANIFLHKDPHEDGPPIVKVLDFGVAKNLGHSDGLHTAVGGTVGSPLYMSPEQVRAQRDVDPRADLWALGVVLFEMIAGQRPFDGDATQVFTKILTSPIPSLDRYVRRIEPGLVAVVDRCLQRDRAQRWSSALEVVAALEPYIARNEKTSGAWPNAALGPAASPSAGSGPYPAYPSGPYQPASATPGAPVSAAAPASGYGSGPYPAYSSGGYPAAPASGPQPALLDEHIDPDDAVTIPISAARAQDVMKRIAQQHPQAAATPLPAHAAQAAQPAWPMAPPAQAPQPYARPPQASSPDMQAYGHPTQPSSPDIPISARPPQASAPDLAPPASQGWIQGGTVKLGNEDAAALRQHAANLRKTEPFPQAHAPDPAQTTAPLPNAPVLHTGPGGASLAHPAPTGTVSTTTPLMSRASTSGSSSLGTISAPLLEEQRKRKRNVTVVVGVLVGLFVAGGVLFAILMSGAPERPELTPEQAAPSAGASSAVEPPSAPEPAPPPGTAAPEPAPSADPTPTASAAADTPPEPSTAPSATAATAASPSPPPNRPAPRPAPKPAADPCAGKTGFLLTNCRRQHPR